MVVHHVWKIRLGMIIERYFAAYGFFAAVGFGPLYRSHFDSCPKFLVLPIQIGFQKTGKFKPGIKTHHA